MSRAKDSVLRINGSLVTTEPLHVGSARFDLETDLPLALDGQRRYYVPGTSIAGALRSWMFEHFGATRAVAELWGDAEDLGASRLIVDDAFLPTEQEIWDGVGIDRETGVAASGVKFDRAVMPAGSKLALAIEVELPADPAIATDCRSLIGWLLQALKDEQIGLGGGRTRGLGTVKLEGVVIFEENWSNRKKVLEWLENGGGRTLRINELVKAAGLKPRAPARIDIEIAWVPEGPMMVKAGRDGLAVDMVPMVSGTAGQVGMVIPGSSIKGALRSQAERIVRTVTGAPLPTVLDDGPRRHRTHIDVPLVRSIFGGPRSQTTTGEPTLRADDEWQLVAPMKGALTIASCFATSLRASWSKWQALVTAADESQLDNSIQDLGAEFKVSSRPAPNLQTARHVGIDRWTGAAADSILFSAIEPFDVEWTPIKMRFELERVDADQRDAAIALLLLLVRDLVQKRIGLGFGHNRGYGGARINAAIVTLHGGDDATAYGWLDKKNVADLATLDVAKVKELEMAWQKWIERQPAPAVEEVLT